MPIDIFEDLDDLVLTIEQRLLDALADRLAGAQKSADPVQNLCHFASAYQTFTLERPKLWNLLFEHQMPDGWVAPPPFQARLDRVRRIVEEVCIPIVGDADESKLHRTAVTVWGTLFGLSHLASTDKLRTMTQEHVEVLVDDLMRTLAKGLADQRAKPKRKKK